LPQLNRPLSKHHEFCTAVSLRILEIWDQNGISTYGFNPVMTYNNEADKFINNHANASGKMVDPRGNYYYVSHPPFAYYFPYFVFKLLHIKPDVLPLQVLNFFLHFISGLFVYFTVCLLSFNRARSYPHLASIVAFTVYIFSPATLWFQGNIYMSDMAVHCLFVMSTYAVLKMIIRQKFSSPKYIFFYVLLLFLMIYTSWLGVFFAIGVLVYSLIHVRQNKGFRTLIWSTIIVALLSLRVITYQYTQINGMEAYLSEIVNRYLLRGSVTDTQQGLFHFLFSYVILAKHIIYNYIVNYLPVYLLLGGFVWLALTRAKLKIVFSENGYRFIWLSVLPVLLLHFFFLNYSEQDFTVLYASLLFSVLLGILYDKIKKSGVFSIAQINSMVFAFIAICIVQFYVTNRPGNTSFSGALYAAEQNAAKVLTDNSTKQEVLFVQGMAPEPQVIWYAKRNVKFVQSDEEALAFLKQRKIEHGVIFGYNGKYMTLIKKLDSNI
jgi:hypothetical protein